MMKYFILLCDGMADLPIPALTNQTPMEAAGKQKMNELCRSALCGMVNTVPEGVEPGSGPANMSVMGYDPRIYYTGRSPLEALSLGVEMQPTDMIYRMNFVSLSGQSNNYEDLSMLDYSSGEITTGESTELVSSIREAFEADDLHFYPGKSYRHCMVWNHGPAGSVLTPPHDISGEPIADHLPKGDGAERILNMMKASREILRDHPVNIRRRNLGLNTADSIWLWGQGTKPGMADFYELFGKKGAVISAVDLIFGLARGSGLDVIEVDGATGNLDTNFAGKAYAAVEAFRKGYDYVYLHVEAPDECGHHGDAKGKIEAIERISKEILETVSDYLEENHISINEPYRILVLPDHPTPVSTRAHSSDPVPFFLFDSEKKVDSGVSIFCEKEARNTGVFYSSGPELFQRFIQS
jgi:2,3-bisphosphoglycerate-independent phosphoglycerate mutase